MISAKVIADSKNEFGNRITTMVVTFPRIILAEFNTHRMFSRNSASSRAIPFEKMVKSVEENPFIPIAWQKDHKGMQGTEYFTEEGEINSRRLSWCNASLNAVYYAKELSKDNVTKQLCNRLLEPFMWHTVIVTATEYENFFALRCPQYSPLLISETQIYRSKKDWLNAYPHLKDTAPKDYLSWTHLNKGQAEIHMMALAEEMWDAYNESQPELLKSGEWHTPFKKEILDQNREEEFLSLPYSDLNEDAMKFYEMCKVKISTVMAARTSYTVVGADQKPMTYKRMIELHDEMLKADPKHLSPSEHCAKAMDANEYMSNTHTKSGKCDRFKEDIGQEVEIESAQGIYTMDRGWSGNFRGFIQYRKMFKNENITKGN